MRCVTWWGSVCLAAALGVAGAGPAAAKCTVTIGSVEGVGTPQDLESIRVSGTAERCEEVEVWLQCRAISVHLFAQVQEDAWEVEFPGSYAQRSGCGCRQPVRAFARGEGKRAAPQGAGRSPGSGQEVECSDEEQGILECSPAVRQVTYPLRYPVKFVCGLAKEKHSMVARGQYFTAINVFNPTRRTAFLRERFTLSHAAEDVEARTASADAEIPAGEAIEIDCPAIRERFGGTQDFLKGFVILDGRGSLDVVAVYTAGGPDGHPRAMDVEEVAARPLRGPDLRITRVWSTGKAPSTPLTIHATVRNDGSDTAGPSTACLRLALMPRRPDEEEPVACRNSAPVPALAPGQEDSLQFPQQVSGDPDFPRRRYLAIVDYLDAVEETDEGNNALAWR